jgi:hypothetical protein
MSTTPSVPAIPDKAVTVDGLIAEHAAKLQRIYDDQTAGDHTFTGVLAQFATAVLLRLSADRDTETATWVDVVISKLTRVGGPDVAGAVATLQSLAASLRGEQDA